MEETPEPLGALISVSILEESVAFYCDVFGIDVQVRNEDVAVLSNTTASTILTLRAWSRSPTRYGPDALGARALIWRVATLRELNGLEDRLKARHGFRTRLSLGSHEAVIGFDPSGTPLAFLSSSTGSRMTIEDLTEVPAIVYSIDT